MIVINEYKVCNNCNAIVDSQARFCPNCGGYYFSNYNPNAYGYYMQNANQISYVQTLQYFDQYQQPVKKKSNVWKIIVAVIAILVVALASVFVIKNIAKEDLGTYTVMVYMVGSDLESQGAAASLDILEMAESDVDVTNTNILICTGGAYQWAIGIPNDRTCIYKLVETDGEKSLELVWDTPVSNMGDEDTLSEFLNYGYENYPADHYGLICWDHGSGPVGGFGYDEVYDNDCLWFNELHNAMEESPFNSENKLEWVGFDACLMASIEIANLFSDYAEYLIASEETEPGCGWDYSFLSTFNTTSNTEKIAESIIDSYAEYIKENAEDMYYPDATLSCMDLSKVDDVSEAMDSLFSKMDGDLEDIDGYISLARLRGEVKVFGKSQGNTSGYDLVDMGNFAEVMSDRYSKEAKELSKAIEKLVIYETSNITSASGVSIYYPYNSTLIYDYFEQLEILGETSLSSMHKSSAYCEYFENFAEIWTGGQDVLNWKGTVPKINGGINEEEPDDSGALTMQLTEQQMDELSAAYYTILFKSGDESYVPVLANCKVEPDSDGLISVSLDQEVIVAESNINVDSRFWAFKEVEQRDDGTVYQSISTSLEGPRGAMAGTDPQWVDINIMEDSDTGEIIIKSINYCQEDTWLSGKQTVDMSKWDNISFSFTGYVPESDEEQNMKPFYEWESDGSIWAYNFAYDDSFRFEKRSIKEFDNEFIIQITLVDINGNVYGSELASMENDNFPKTHIESNEVGAFKWKLYNDYAELVSYQGPSTSIEIPEEVKGLPVTEISGYAFNESNNCLEEIILPDTIELLNEYVFGGCVYLKSIELPESLIEIPANAFDSCSSLTEVKVPDSVKYIGRGAFDDCIALTDIYIPESVEVIGSGAFAGCDSLSNLTVDKKNKYYTSIDSVLFSKDEKTLVACPGTYRTSYEVPEGVEEICDFAFAYCYREEVDYSSYYDSDSKEVQYTGTGLTSIVLPDTLKVIGDGAFFECQRFESIEIPESVEYIGSMAFDRVDGFVAVTSPQELAQLKIGANVSWIGLNAFSAYEVNDLQVSEDNMFYSSKNGELMNKSADMVMDVFAEKDTEE